MVRNYKCLFTIFLSFILGITSLLLYQNTFPSDPEKAVIRYVSNWDNAKQIQFSSNSLVPMGGGYIVAGKHPNGDYQLFYTWINNGKWKVVNLNIITPNYLISGTPFDDTTGTQENWSYSAVWSKENAETKAVVGYTRLVGGVSHTVPFSLEQIGNLPIWVHKYQTTIFMMTYADAFDSAGKKIWTTWR